MFTPLNPIPEHGAMLCRCGIAAIAQIAANTGKKPFSRVLDAA
jgi:hypothetical protein